MAYSSHWHKKRMLDAGYTVAVDFYDEYAAQPEGTAYFRHLREVRPYFRTHKHMKVETIWRLEE